MLIKHVKDFVAGKVHIVSRLVPKKKRLWVFGCWSGRLYADNSKYLFEYICLNHPEIETVWITRTDYIEKEVTDKGYNCYKRFSLKGILCALRAEVAFITSDELNDVSLFVDRKCTKIVQLYHGLSGKGTNIYISEKDKIVTRNRFNNYYWMATSDKYKEIFSEEYGINPQNFAITGYPRNDIFVTKPYNENMEQLKAKYSDSKFIIYMPTHRAYGKRPIDISEFDTINEKLKQYNIMMVYKPHFNELKNVENNNVDYSNIILAKDQHIWGDVYAYIHYFDLLISDYSSIVYDYLCAEKPIVLYVYDMEYMRNSDFGIMDFFERIPPGPFCYTWQETLNQVCGLLENDQWKQKRNICRELFHPFKDGKNSQRVFAATSEFMENIHRSSPKNHSTS